LQIEQEKIIFCLIASLHYITVQFKVNKNQHFSHFTVIYGKRRKQMGLNF